MMSWMDDVSTTFLVCGRYRRLRTEVSHHSTYFDIHQTYAALRLDGCFSKCQDVNHEEKTPHLCFDERENGGEHEG
jgi:hypothetical protein